MDRKVIFQSLELNQGPLTHEANALPTELLWMLKDSEGIEVVLCEENMIAVEKILHQICVPK